MCACIFASLRSLPESDSTLFHLSIKSQDRYNSSHCQLMKHAFQVGTRELGKTYSSYLDLPEYGHMYTIFQAARIMRLAMAAHRQAFVLHQLVSRGNPLFLVYPLAMP